MQYCVKLFLHLLKTMIHFQYGISGEGFLPGEEPDTKRRKRCSECSLGSITRTSTGMDWPQIHKSTGH